ncbi:hypothetical protein GCK32_007689 [Trichostrongylus colubriformis]|uniref:Uncharacterized protein n=1 Tax=Trichostrongylus colubriformis TaxID=6319 RepID=A0AAN8FYR5_TRICO
MFYKECQDIPNDSRLANVRPIQVYQEMAHQVFSSDVASEAERDDVLSYFSDDGYKHRRKAPSRATSKLHDARVTMEEVPREYAYLAGGPPILHLRTDELHKYCWNVEKACQLGMFALVADGVHDLQPEATNKTGQLCYYPWSVGKLHGYTTSVCHHSKEECATGGRLDLRIVPVFEKAAINAARKNDPYLRRDPEYDPGAQPQDYVQYPQSPTRQDDPQACPGDSSMTMVPNKKIMLCRFQI